MKHTFILTFILLGTIHFTYGQSRKITGHITDQQRNEPLVGVTVVVKDTMIGTATDIQGNFTLNVPADKNILVLSYVGYRKQEVSILDRSAIDVVMAPENEMLDEIVVTAMGIKRSKKSLGYSTTTVDGLEVNQAQSINLASSLVGKVAGLNISNSATGSAGSKRIVIRGAASLTGNNQPLIVIDGVAINTSASTGGLISQGEGIDYGNALNDINPDDIANISVLKSNAAAALYGSRASNGAILITTKDGANSEGKLNVQFNSSLLIDKLYNPTDFQTVYGQSSRVLSNAPPVNADDAYSSSSWGPKMEGQEFVQFNGDTLPFLPRSDGNYDRFFQTGNTLTNTVAVSGGTKKINFRVSASDLRNRDIMPNSDFRRNNLNTKISTQLGKLKVNTALKYTHQVAHNRPYLGGSSSNLFYSLVYMPANLNVETLKPGYRPDGTEFSFAESLSNPYWHINKVKEIDTKNVFSGNLDLTYDLSKWLYARGTISGYFYEPRRSYIKPPGSLYATYPLGELQQYVSTSTQSSYQLLLRTHNIDMGKFAVNAMAGASTEMRENDRRNTSGNSFVVPDIFTYNNLSNKLGYTSNTQQKTNSLFGSFELSYNEYLYLTLTGRNDWFSTLPIQNNNLFYPSASLSFVFSDAFKLPSWITYGKFRTSAGQVSGDPDPGQLQLSYTLARVQYNSLPLQYIGTETIPNKDLVPLLSTDYEVGLDMNFFDNRLGFDVSYYNRHVIHDIVYSEVPVSSGFGDAILNVGKLNSNGIDIAFHITPIETKQFSWKLNTTFSKNNNKVISLGPGNPPIILSGSRGGNAYIQLVAGDRYGSIYGYDYLKDPATGKQVYDPTGFPKHTDGTVFLGNGQYDKIVGLRNTITYKNFSFYFLIDGKFGADVYSETNYMAMQNGKSKATLPGRVNGLDVSGVSSDEGEPFTAHIRGYDDASSNTGIISIQDYYQRLSRIDRYNLYNGNFIKLRELSLGYRFPSAMLNRIGITYLKVSMVARNVLNIMDHIPNVDPESIRSTGNAQGFERLSYPVTRQFGLKIDVNL